MSTTAVSAAPSLASEARLYWRKYLWHHRDPGTRRLHRIGSWVCIAGFVATAMGYGLAWTPLAIAFGYAFAFAGHWLVEKNRPLTFENPIRAGIGNWAMFFFEMFGDVDHALAQIALDPPQVDDMGSQ